MGAQKMRVGRTWNKIEATKKSRMVAAHKALERAQATRARVARDQARRVTHARNVQRAMNRRWAGIVAKANAASRRAHASWRAAVAGRAKAWAIYRAANGRYVSWRKSYMSAVSAARAAVNRRAYWLKKARVAHHRLAMYVRAGHRAGYLH